MAEKPIICTPEDVLRFWFEECTPKDWFGSTVALDAEIGRRFRETHLALAAGVPDLWRATPDSHLAVVIVFDQFPRNIYRGTPLAFATDGLALREARAALAAGADRDVAIGRRMFFYMPFEHAEDLDEQDRSVGLFRSLGDEEYFRYAEAHRAVIAEFGRFPHRNAVVGRSSTEAEKDYLAKPGAGFG